MADSLLGDAVTLECAAEAWPVPRVTWHRHGGQLPVNRHRYVLGQFITRDALVAIRSLVMPKIHYTRFPVTCWQQVVVMEFGKRHDTTDATDFRANLL